MGERLITKEELLEYIQTHDVGLSVEDFVGINLEDFIASRHLTLLNIESLWKKSLETYLRDLEWNERAIYMAQEKRSIESTEGEYERFIQEFFAAIGVEVVFSADELDFHRYDILAASGTMNKMIIYIAQTKNIEKFNIYTNMKSTRPELLEVFIENGPDGAGTSGNFCYSKNNKFMMLANLYDERLFEYVKVFCKIDN